MACLFKSLPQFINQNVLLLFGWNPRGNISLIVQLIKVLLVHLLVVVVHLKLLLHQHVLRVHLLLLKEEIPAQLKILHAVVRRTATLNHALIHLVISATA